MKSYITTNAQTVLTRIGKAALLATALWVVAAASPVLADRDKEDNQKDNRGIFPPQSEPYGCTYSEWAGKWWHWALSLPPAVNPLTDTSGEYGAVGQSGPVWFLAGVWGANEPVERTCTVPPDKGLFFPIFNIVDVGGEWVVTDDIPAILKQFRKDIKPGVDSATGLACEIDGKPVRHLQSYREQSVVFRLTFPVDNLFNWTELADYTDWLGVDDGYYLMLAPLEPGEHTIHFHANTMDVTYHLTVRYQVPLPHQLKVCD